MTAMYKPWIPKSSTHTTYADVEVIALKNKSIRQKSHTLLSLSTMGLLLLWPFAAWAHVEAGQAGGLASGLLHPVSGLDHVLAMIAVGLWGAQLGSPAVWLLPVAFPMMMAFGGMLGLIGIPVPGVEVGIALSAVILGALILGEARLPLAGAVLVVAFFAIFHGHAHGTELMPGQNAMLYSLGFVIATGTLHAVGIGIGLVHRWKAGRLVLRGAGSVVLAGGLFFLWGALV
jgi:urease accessory protein